MRHLSLYGYGNSLTVVSQRTIGGYMDILLITILHEIVLRQKWMGLDLVYCLCARLQISASSLI